jgi:hypothetical protein
VAKVGRPKNLRPHEIKLNVPTDPLFNQAKRLYWALLEYEKKMSKDITSVRMKDYTDLLQAYEDACIKLKKIGHRGRYAKARMESPELVKIRDAGGTSEVGGNESAQLGTGISATNPLA